MSEEIANHSEESPIEVERDADTEALYESFGMPQQKTEKKDIEFPQMEEPQLDEDDALTTEQEPDTKEETPTPEKRTLILKYNGEDKEVDEEEARILAQKGMNYDKVQQKLTEQEKALDEVAQLQGFKDHADLIANLPKLREQQQQKQQAEFDEVRQSVIDQLVYNGVSEENAIAFAENNPLVQKARAELQQSEQKSLETQKQAQQESILSGWNELFQSVPDIEKRELYFKDDRLFFKGEGLPDWVTPEMTAKLDRGYSPIDAFTLAHRDKFTAQTKKATEQKLIKQQQLGVRGQVDTNTATPPDEASLLPAQIAYAEEYGVDIKGVQRQAKLLKNRR